MEELEQEITIKEMIQAIREYRNYLAPKWKMIILGCFVGAVLGVAASFVYHPKYKASLKFIVDGSNSAGGLASLASGLGLGGLIGGNESFYSAENIMEFLKTRSMVEEALLLPVQENGYRDRTYADVYIKEYKMDKGWEDDSILQKIQFKIGEKRANFGREKDSILFEVYTQIVEKRLSVSQIDKENSFIQIDVKTRSEVFSKNFPAELVSIVSKYYSNFKTQKDKVTIAALQYQVDSINRLMYASMGGAASSLDQVFGLNPAMSVHKTTSAKEQAQVQINIAALSELVKNLEISKLSLLNNTPIINIVDFPIYPLEITEITVIAGILLGFLLGGFAMTGFYVMQKIWNDFL